MFRITSLLATTLLLVTACGTKTDTGASPSTTPSATVPDKASCDAATAVVLVASLRISGAAIAIEFAGNDPAKRDKALKEFGEGMTVVVSSIDEAMGKATHPEVKAVVKEYQDLTKEVQASLTTNANDTASLVTKLESVAERMEKTGARLDKLCVSASPSPKATAGSEREAVCADFKKVQAEFVGTAFEALAAINKPGATRAEIDKAVATIVTSLDEIITKTKQLSVKTTDSELSTAFKNMAAELESLKKQRDWSAGRG